MWNKKEYEIIEALLIMNAAKTYSLHNTQIDFLPKPGSTITGTTVTNLLLSAETFQTKIKQNVVKLPKLATSYEFKTNPKLQDMHPVLKTVLENEQVIRAVARKTAQQTKKKPAKDKTERQTKQRIYTNGIRKAFSGKNLEALYNALPQLADLLHEYTVK